MYGESLRGAKQAKVSITTAMWYCVSTIQIVLNTRKRNVQTTWTSKPFIYFMYSVIKQKKTVHLFIMSKK